jgi:vacuolar protein sorting-associated protein 13A/C
MVGLLDMASNVTAGIRETTTVFEAGTLGRERIPRYVGKDEIVTVSNRRNSKYSA